MSRRNALIASIFLVLSVAAPLWGDDLQLVASGKWDLWDDTGGSAKPDREKGETPAGTQSETHAASVHEPSDARETAKSDDSHTAKADKAEAITVRTGSIPEQNSESMQGEDRAVQPSSKSSANKTVAKAAPVTPVAEQDAKSASGKVGGEQSPKTDALHQPDSKTAQALQVAEQHGNSERKDADIGRPEKTVSSDKSTVSASAESDIKAKVASIGAGSLPDSAGTVSAGTGAEYIIGPGDFLDVSVWKDEVLSRTVVVLTDGSISFPLIGKIKAAGRTIAQVKDEIIKKLVRYYPEPEVNIEVKQSNSMLIYVIGRVNAPGRQVLNANIDVIQALTMAGGPNPFASRNKIKILRKEGDKTVVLPFRYDDVIEGKIETNVELKRGDVIVVP